MHQITVIPKNNDEGNTDINDIYFVLTYQRILTLNRTQVRKKELFNQSGSV